jgi:hypothetical protein
MKTAIILAALLALLAGSALAECRRLPVRQNPNVLDGPGSFGPLHGTLTLDCLTYAGSMNRDGKEWVLLKDEQGTVHRVGVGSYVGPGVITKIDAEFIHVEVFAPAGVIRFPRAPR